MADRTLYRLRDIVESIDRINALLARSDFDDLFDDHVRRAAFERFLEILSEASRHIPEEMKAMEPSVPWRRVADIGNHLRHAYHKVDFEVLWNTWKTGELADLRDAVGRMLARLGP